jgi:hypothetical protein
MEQILEKELGTLSACYLKRITKEMLPSKIEVMGASIYGFRVRNFDEGENGNNISQVGKQEEKTTRGWEDEFYP